MSGTIWTPSPAVSPTAAIRRSLDFLTLLTIIVSPTFRKYAAATSMLPPRTAAGIAEINADSFGKKLRSTSMAATSKPTTWFVTPLIWAMAMLPLNDVFAVVPPSPASKLPIPSANKPPETRSFSTFTGFPSLLTIAMAWMSPYVSSVVRT